jgi:predicted metal-binding membrane protein
MTVRDRAVRGSAAATSVALIVTLLIAGASWVVAVARMRGMDMGVATPLGSFGSFVIVWVSMMAAMMLPGTVPAVVNRTRATGRMRAAPLFVGSYLAVWVVMGLAVYALYRPHSSIVAGAVAVAAGVYELTPLKRRCRRLCRESVGSGAQFGLYCVGSSIGLMLILVAVSVMSVAWMLVIAVIVATQKLLPARAAFDVALAVAIVGLGVLIITAPTSVPGVMPPM